MKKSGIKMCTTALALAACLAAPVALAACGEKTGGTAGGGSGKGDKCTVTFDAGRGTIFGDRFYTVNVEKGATVAEPGEIPVSDGEYFLGWNVTGDRTDAMWNFDSEKVMSDMTLYAVWARACTVTFDADGGTFANGKGTYTVTVADGSKLTAPEVTAPTDRVLGGWSDGYIVWDFATDTVDRDTTLTATWELTAELETALEPFTYTESASGFTVTGIKDKNATSVVVPSCVTEIEEEAFKDCAELTSVVINDSVKNIGGGAFNGCAKLRTVTLPSSLTRIENSTFGGCASLPEIDIPDTVKYVGASAFSGCASLKSVILPVGVTELNNYLFNGCSSLESVEIKGAVTSINYRAFYGCVKLTDFDITSSVTEIGQLAFYGCESLVSVVIPGSCKKVDSSAFGACTGLTSATINCEELGYGVFNGCTSLATLDIGANVKTIGDSAFGACVSLTVVDVPDGVTELGTAAFSGCKSLERVTLGTGVTSIKSGLFNSCHSLRDISINGAITAIESNSFVECRSLISFTIPATVTNVYSRAFDRCLKLVEVVKTNPNTVIASNAVASNIIIGSEDESKIERSAGFVFYPQSNARAPYRLIDYVGTGENVVLPEQYNGGAYTISNYALAYNKNIKSVTLPSHAEYLSPSILCGSTNVTELKVASGNTKVTAQGNCIIEKGSQPGDPKKLVIGCKTSVIPTDESIVDTIGSDAFAGVALPVGFTIPSNITTIESGAFEDCEHLMHKEGNVVYLDNWAISCTVEGSTPVTIELAAGTVGIAGDFIGYYAEKDEYKSWSKVGALVCNDDLKHISGRAFYHCTNLTEVRLNDGLLSLGAYAFSTCAKLLEIDLPDSVTSVGMSAFKDCTSLTYAKLPDGLTSMNEFMFSGCSKLKTVVIPSSVTKIGRQVFNGCGALTVVYYGGSDLSAWQSIYISSDGNTAVANTSKIRFYSETEAAGKWHFGADGKPVMW